MPTTIDKEGISVAYEDVRNDSTETTWALFTYDGKKIVVHSTGTRYEELITHFPDDECCFAFIRMTTGDELSKRAKFALITWCGPGASVMKKANLTVDKSLVKEVVKSYAVDIFTSDKNEVSESRIRTAIQNAGGANYGSGK